MNSHADPPNELFTTLADPTRRALFERLCREGELTVRALTNQAGVSQPAVSKHLGVLKLAGLVETGGTDGETHYRAEPKGLAPLIDWMSLYGAFWRGRFDRPRGSAEEDGPMTNARPKRSPSLSNARYLIRRKRSGAR